MSHVVHDHRAVTLHRRGLPPQMHISTPQLGAACVVAAAADPGPSPGAVSSSSSSSGALTRHCARVNAGKKYRTAHATRERIRVEAFNVAFCELRRLLPTLPPDKKLSKIEILKLAICYIAYLNHVLDV
ncbi:helix-loop-helix protein 1-like [Schistocerca americana]|uniref:helix-loop-helix protein 1-like n=1 Tax=Schistocerca americana TaxID=7009 RepID=UPI001F4FC338|nr:helix-loop-helix protein 1-like [Schistocerca americana]